MRGVDDAQLTLRTTRPVYLLRMEFDTVVRLTTGATVNWTAQGGVFTNAEWDFDGTPPRLSLFNDLLSLGITVLTDGTAGRGLTLWESRVDSGASSSLPGHTEPVMLFDGEMGSADIGDRIEIETRRWRQQFTPRYFMGPPLFNHIPAPGTVIETPTQKVTLE